MIPERKTVFIIIIYREIARTKFHIGPITPVDHSLSGVFTKIFHLWVFNAVTNKYITWDGKVKQSFHFYMFKEHVE